LGRLKSAAASFCLNNSKKIYNLRKKINQFTAKNKHKYSRLTSHLAKEGQLLLAHASNNFNDFSYLSPELL